MIGPPYGAIPGVLRHRRPELYGEIVAPRDLYDFWQHERGTLEVTLTEAAAGSTCD